MDKESQMAVSSEGICEHDKVKKMADGGFLVSLSLVSCFPDVRVSNRNYNMKYKKQNKKAYRSGLREGLIFTRHRERTGSYTKIG